MAQAADDDLQANPIAWIMAAIALVFFVVLMFAMVISASDADTATTEDPTTTTQPADE
ncbi:MAG: hypothetical protein OEV40_06425 [Acidimicrobiia bacterium]|nr:hypothetical protein [Acidimicrobiia bacterium]